ncbi:hypothetical protein [Acetobacter syzygii]|uniref:hypothetical protein n=1 Tax=Acetobacter syzygii TaxID=146476 RepID=UPI0039E79AF8
MDDRALLSPPTVSHLIFRFMGRDLFRVWAEPGRLLDRVFRLPDTTKNRQKIYRQINFLKRTFARVPKKNPASTAFLLENFFPHRCA